MPRWDIGVLGKQVQQEYHKYFRCLPCFTKNLFFCCTQSGAIFCDRNMGGTTASLLFCVPFSFLSNFLQLYAFTKTVLVELRRSFTKPKCNRSTIGKWVLKQQLNMQYKRSYYLRWSAWPIWKAARALQYLLHRVIMAFTRIGSNLAAAIKRPQPKLFFHMVPLCRDCWNWSWDWYSLHGFSG
jgi:hypothetical protein